MQEEIYFAAGCFWGAQKYFKLIDGVLETEVGYANGRTENPTYEEVYTDQTGFAEAVRVIYDSEKVPLEFLVGMFFKAVDPLSLNRQGEDSGTRYRTGIYYLESVCGTAGKASLENQTDDMAVIRKVYDSVADEHGCDLAVEVLPLKNFYAAEEMHQDYLDKNPDGYCHLPEALFEYAKNAGKK